MKAYLILIPVLIAFSCGNNNTNDATPQTSSEKPSGDSAVVKGEPFDLKLSGIHFTKSVNGADTSIDIGQNDKISFRAGAQTDYFSDPADNKLSNTAAILLAEVDNTKPFTLTSKVTPSFTPTGTYNAGVLYIYVHDNLWQKLCFEQDERANHRIVSVRTIGTSDDNNHAIVTTASVYMKISSDTRTVASYYSTDKKTWNLARIYKNSYPSKIWVGISAQCPVEDASKAEFEEISLVGESVKDFRMGD